MEPLPPPWHDDREEPLVGAGTSGDDEVFRSESSAFCIAETQLVWSTVQTRVLDVEFLELQKLLGQEAKQKKLPAQNKALLRELHCLREILSEFRDQNDSLLQAKEQEAKTKKSLLDTPQRGLVTDRCRNLLDELGSIATTHGVPLASVLPQKDPVALRYVMNHSDIENEKSSRPSTARPTTGSSSGARSSASSSRRMTAVVANNKSSAVKNLAVAGSFGGTTMSAASSSGGGSFAVGASGNSTTAREPHQKDGISCSDTGQTQSTTPRRKEDGHRSLEEDPNPHHRPPDGTSCSARRTTSSSQEDPHLLPPDAVKIGRDKLSNNYSSCSSSTSCSTSCADDTEAASELDSASCAESHNSVAMMPSSSGDSSELDSFRPASGASTRPSTGMFASPGRGSIGGGGGGACGGGSTSSGGSASSSGGKIFDAVNEKTSCSTSATCTSTSCTRASCTSATTDVNATTSPTTAATTSEAGMPSSASPASEAGTGSSSASSSSINRFSKCQLRELAVSVRQALRQEHRELLDAVNSMQKQLEDELSFRDDTVKRLRAHDSVTLVTTERLQDFSSSLEEAVRLGHLESPVFLGLQKQSSSQRLRSLVQGFRQAAGSCANLFTGSPKNRKAALAGGGDSASSAPLSGSSRHSHSNAASPSRKGQDADPKQGHTGDGTASSATTKHNLSTTANAKTATASSRKDPAPSPDSLTEILARSAGVDPGMESMFFG
ncbi:unnamed protein product [Amoebophrya sp. A25]|nr:unnamed protein product [Amoebophrya sp. A25]|eukprot:GSA25T00013036001.1